MDALNFRVLLVDDEEEFVSVLAERLSTRGLTVQTAFDGRAALELVEKETFDAVVLDLAMPGIDGIETLKAMRQHNPDLQVILLSGRATLEKGVEAMKLGALDFLEKPVVLPALLERVKQAAQKKLALREKRSEEQIAEILAKMGW